MNREYENITPLCMESDKGISHLNVNSAVIIPALNPMENLVEFVYELLGKGIPEVIVVNDGSDSSFNNIFKELTTLEHCTVLLHKTNQGKGRALKTAFTYFIEHFSSLNGVVTADADGQHAVEDIYKICQLLSLRQDSLILGVRDFKKDNVPKRSYIGNMITSHVFQLLYGSSLNDTQTGLRGIPSDELAWMVETGGERYDFEINMLIKARRRNLNFITIPINTLYFNNNSGSHYNTIRDSALITRRLFSGLIRYSGSTIVSGFIDILAFFLLNTVVFSAFFATVRIFFSTVIARITSSLCNFLMNRRLIFTDAGKLADSVIRYYVLCVSLMIASYVLVLNISTASGINPSIIKLMVDFTLGIVSYQVQLRWVFRSKEKYDTSVLS